MARAPSVQEPLSGPRSISPCSCCSPSRLGLVLIRLLPKMHRAVYANDLSRLQFFMAERPRGLKQADHHGNTPLLLALKLARTEMAWLMIRAGADLDVPSDGSFHLLVSRPLVKEKGILRGWPPGGE